MFVQRMLDLKSVQTRDIFNTYIYRSDTDSSAEIQAAGYFNESRFADSDPEGWANGKIEVKAADGYLEGFIDSGGSLVPEIGSFGSNPYAFIYKVNGTENTPLDRFIPAKIVATTIAKRLVGFTTDSLGAVTYSGPSFYARCEFNASGGRNGAGEPRFLSTIAKNGVPVNIGNTDKAIGGPVNNIEAITADLLIEDGDELTSYIENITWFDDWYTNTLSFEVTFQRWA